MRSFLPLLLVACVCACAATDEEFFEKKIRPVLAGKCYDCHNSKLKVAMGGLRLDTADGLRKGGDSGAIVTPGDPSKSRLVEAIRYQNLRLKMPPTGKLSDAQIADFEEWIRAGAVDPRKEAPMQAAAQTGIDLEKGRRFWAFQPVANPAVPRVRDRAWVRTPVDAFVLAKLEGKGWRPAPPVSKREWIRRITFDLTGLPPSPTEVSAYLADNSPQADGRVADRLLASPHYGERWARHWLDLMRFAETNGHEFDNEKLDAWRYRDYVIRAFNQDLRYDRFVKEHIAGDLLPDPRVSPDGTTLESPVASGSFWLWEVLNSATDSVKSRADRVDNQIDVMGKAFLGLTLACARCHDHKFDPIATKDYYGLAGIMHSTYLREAVIDSPSRAKEIASMHRRVAEINAEISKLTPPTAQRPAQFKPGAGEIVFEDFEQPGFGNWFSTGEAFALGPMKTRPPNQPLSNYGGEGMANSFGLGTDRLMGSLTSKKFHMPKIWVHVRMAGVKGDPKLKEAETLRLTVVADDHPSIHFAPTGKGKWEWVSRRMTKEIGRICYIEIIDRNRNGHIAVDRIVFSDSEKPPEEISSTERSAGAMPLSEEAKIRVAALERERAAVEAGIPASAFGMLSMDETPHNVRLHIRGSHENLGEEVPRHFPGVLSKGAPPLVTEGSGRLQLAEWMTSNPMTARVMVNRIWKHHFGQGLVRSTDNFGKMGEAPEHGELLDWLASTFETKNWSVKEMHRQIVLSNAYRMSSRPEAAASQGDPRNGLIHHMPVRRLEAEAIRDSILAVSGKLDTALYGPSVMPHISKYQDGRGKPVSGPLDGNGRRSIYIQVRRNFIPPLFLAFDYPLPVSTTGTRGVSTVPSQALMLLNNEFVMQAAASWARKAAAEEPDARKKIDGLYESAFARPAEEWETEETLAYVEREGGGEKAWTSLCHVLLNSAEFIYVR